MAVPDTRALSDIELQIEADPQRGGDLVNPAAAKE